MSNVWGIYLIGTLVRGALVVVVLLALEAVLRRKLLFSGGRWFYAGLLALMLLPVGMVGAGGGGQGESSSGLDELLSYVAAFEPFQLEAWGAQTDIAGILPTPSGSPVSAAAAVPGAGAKSIPFGWGLVLIVGYGFIVFALLARQFGQFIRWRGKVRRCGAITGGRVYDLFCQAKVQTGMEKRRIELRDGSAVSGSPACFGSVFGECLLCPLCEMGHLSDAEIRMLLIHELGHLRSFDNLASSVLRMAGGFLFFNVFWRILARRAMTVRELDCDALVVKIMGLEPAGKAAYARLLLMFQLKANCVSGAALGATARELKLRIGEIGMKKGKYSVGVIAILLMVFAGVSMLSPACYGGQETAPAVKEEPSAVNAAPSAVASPSVMDSARKIVPYLPENSTFIYGLSFDAVKKLREYPIADKLLSLKINGKPDPVLARLVGPGDLLYLVGQRNTSEATAILVTNRTLDQVAADSGVGTIVIDSKTREFVSENKGRIYEAAPGVFAFCALSKDYAPGAANPKLAEYLNSLSGDASAFAAAIPGQQSTKGDLNVVFSAQMHADMITLKVSPLNATSKAMFAELNKDKKLDKLCEQLNKTSFPAEMTKATLVDDGFIIGLKILAPAPATGSAAE